MTDANNKYGGRHRPCGKVWITDQNGRGNGPTECHGCEWFSVAQCLQRILHRVRKPFQYQPLNTATSEIRLVRIEQSSTTDLPSLKLYHVSLNDNPEHIALSYTWGDSSKKRAVCVNGHRSYVTANLAQFMELVSPVPEYPPIWVDAVCINQSDLAEKGTQVQRIQSIYKKASLVLVWLGTEYGSSSLRSTIDALWRSFFKYLKIDPSTVDREWRPPGTSFIDYCDRLAPIFSEEQPEPPFDVASWEEVAQIFSQAWWTRIWILQEATCNPLTVVSYGTPTNGFNWVAMQKFLWIVNVYGARCRGATDDYRSAIWSVRRAMIPATLLSDLGGARVQYNQSILPTLCRGSLSMFQLLRRFRGNRATFLKI